MAARRDPHPPAWAEALLRALLASVPSAAFIVGDLREEYAARRAVRSGFVAGLWYVGVAVRTGVRSGWEASRNERAAMPAGGRDGSRMGVDGMRVELRQAIRFLIRRPGISAATVLTVALAIAATTAAFTVVDGVLLERLPYRDPDGLVVLWEHNIPRDQRTNVVSPANFMAWRERAKSFEDLGAVIATSGVVTGVGEPERVSAVLASASLFRMIGATAVVGRLYGEADDQPGAARVVVLSEGYWRRRFGADPSVVGQPLRVNDNEAVIVGVLPERFDVPIAADFGGPGTHDIWVPQRFGEDARAAGGRYLEVFGRVRPGVTLEAARAEMTLLADRLRDENPDRQAGWDVSLLSLRDQVVGDIRTLILVIFGAVCLVLLIACANVANLQLTRASARQQEMAVRSALGAGRGRLIRQMLLESLLLSTVGGSLGLLLASLTVQSLIAAAPDIPRVSTLGMDGGVIAFALLATAGTALLFGLAPALHIAGGDVVGWLRERGGGRERRAGNRLRSALVVAQVALSLVLLVGAGLLVRSFANRVALGVGFDMGRMLTAELQLPVARYESRAQTRFFEDLVSRVQAMPGVEAASAITFAPLTGAGSATTFWPMDRPVPPPDEQAVADVRWVHRDYHRVLRLPLIAGRYFDEVDREDAPLAVVINAAGARQLWPHESAIGKRIAMPWRDTLQAVVVGVVGDVRFNGPDTELRPMLYWDQRQFREFSQMTLLARTASDPAGVINGIRAIVRDMDPQLPLYNVQTMESLYGDALARPRFATVSLGLFAALGLLLAAIGIYGVIAFVTQQRSREIGIRLALGADRAVVLRMVVSQGAKLIGLSLAIGAVAALMLTRLLRALVFDISTTDPVTFAAMAAIIAFIGLLASWLPARRASAINPVEAIRHEG